jgi:IclR family KDG regulon transcriptional repressor
MKKEKYFQLNTIIKTFRLIEILVTDRAMSLADLCRFSNMPKTTVHRILLTLQSLGYVHQDKSSLKYMASIKFFELGSMIQQRLNIYEIAHPLMVDLCEQTNETVNLGFLDGIDIVCIDKVESQQQLKLDQPIGSRNKSYCTAFGKAILAYLPEDERRNLYEKYPLVSLTSKTLTSKSALEDELSIVRDRGYAVDDEEGVIGVRCVGAPIFSQNNHVIAGISIAGPSVRINIKDISHLGRLVADCAIKISEGLGSSSFKK